MKAAYILLLFVIGIFVGFYGGYYAAFVLIAILLLCLISERFIKSGSKTIHRSALQRNIIYSTIFIILGSTSAILNSRNIPEIKDLDEYDVTGTIISSKLLTAGELHTLNISTINGIKAEGKVALLTSPDFDFTKNDIINFKSTLEDDTHLRFASPRFRATTLYSDKQPVKIGVDNSLISKFRILSDHIALLIDNSSLNEHARSLLIALIVADRSNLSKEEIAMFRDAGVIHILAVSGMHIGIIYALLLLITRPLVLINRRSRYFLITILIWGFVLFTGCNLSTVRAAIMLTLANFGFMLDRKRDPFDITCFALLFILIFSPRAMFDMGLQLSFASVAAITLFADRLNPINKIKSKRTYNLYSAVLATIIATSTTWIITGYYFGEVSLRFLPANMLILPFLPAYMIIGLFYLALIAFGLDSSIIAFILNGFPDIIYTFLDVVAPHSSAVNVTGLSVLLWLAAIPLLAFALKKRPSYEYNATDDTPAVIINKRWMTASISLFLLSLIAITLNI